MSKKSRLLLYLPLALLVIALTGCPQRRSIAQINGDPGAYFNKEVTVVGTVTHSFGVLGNGAFELDDGTGKIWVLAENYGVPGNGARVGVTGRVIPTVEFGGRSFANAIRETQRRTHP